MSQFATRHSSFAVFAPTKPCNLPQFVTLSPAGRGPFRPGSTVEGTIAIIDQRALRCALPLAAAVLGIVMLAVILVIVVGTIRLIGSNANTVFSNAASAIQ